MPALPVAASPRSGGILPRSLRAGKQRGTRCVQTRDAERPGRHSHAERGNEGRTRAIGAGGGPHSGPDGPRRPRGPGRVRCADRGTRRRRRGLERGSRKAALPRSHAPRGNAVGDAPRPSAGRGASGAAFPRGAWERGTRPLALARAAVRTADPTDPSARGDPVGSAVRTAAPADAGAGRMGTPARWRHWSADHCGRALPILQHLAMDAERPRLLPGFRVGAGDPGAGSRVALR